MTVDTSLYPLDTLKTRLQSSEGFLRAGGFRGVYKGIGSAFIGSAPGAALFFVTYEGIKRNVSPQRSTEHGPGISEVDIHMLAASLGEIAACAVRVPTEVVKQRAQAGQYPTSLKALTSILDLRRTQGFGTMWRELYRGWGITIMREVPFTGIQFPLWESMKRLRISREGGSRRNVSGLESAVFGSISGAVAAALTTPFDVLKTRMMLAKHRVEILPLAQKIMQEEGPDAFFKGIGPRTMWISIGGAVFLGSYQWSSNLLGGRDQHV